MHPFPLFFQPSPSRPIHQDALDFAIEDFMGLWECHDTAVAWVLMWLCRYAKFSLHWNTLAAESTAYPLSGPLPFSQTADRRPQRRSLLHFRYGIHVVEGTAQKHY